MERQDPVSDVVYDGDGIVESIIYSDQLDTGE